MCGFLLRIIINAVLLFLVIGQLPGIFIDTLGGMLLGVVIIGIANAIVRPVLLWMARPLNWLNLGGMTFCMNIIAPLVIIKILPGFQIYSTITPVISILLMTVCSVTLSKVIHDR